MTNINRREFGNLAIAVGVATVATSAYGSIAIAERGARVVVVGGGAGGATVAHYVKRGEPKIEVTLIETAPRYSSSFFSNLYLGGFRTFASLSHDYAGLRSLGLRVVHDFAADVDTAKKILKTRGGRTFNYDRLGVSPGIDIKYDSIDGYSVE